MHSAEVCKGVRARSWRGLALVGIGSAILVSCVLPRSSRGELELMDAQIQARTNLSAEGVFESGEIVLAQQEGKESPVIAFGSKDRPEALSYSEFPNAVQPKKKRSLPLTSRDVAIEPQGHGLIWPVVGRITSPFGMRKGRLHAGIDISAVRGTPIFASQSGQVLLAGRRKAYGKLVVIGHGNELQTLYAHLLKTIVKPGQYVEQGQVIGYVGRTGRATGYHLHFETRVAGGVPQDPLRTLPSTRGAQAWQNSGTPFARVAYLPDPSSH